MGDFINVNLANILNGLIIMDPLFDLSIDLEEIVQQKMH